MNSSCNIKCLDGSCVSFIVFCFYFFCCIKIWTELLNVTESIVLPFDVCYVIIRMKVIWRASSSVTRRLHRKFLWGKADWSLAIVFNFPGTLLTCWVGKSSIRISRGEKPIPPPHFFFVLPFWRIEWKRRSFHKILWELSIETTSTPFGLQKMQYLKTSFSRKSLFCSE